MKKAWRGICMSKNIERDDDDDEILIQYELYVSRMSKKI